MKTLSGKVLWWSERDGNGVIKDVLGNEYYFDSSVNKTGFVPVRGMKVEFNLNSKIKNCLCACDVAGSDDSHCQYYTDELKILSPDDTYSQSIVIHDGQGNKTKFLSLNRDSIPILIEFLDNELKRLGGLK